MKQTLFYLAVLPVLLALWLVLGQPAGRTDTAPVAQHSAPVSSRDSAAAVAGHDHLAALASDINYH